MTPSGCSLNPPQRGFAASCEPLSFTSREAREVDPGQPPRLREFAGRVVRHARHYGSRVVELHLRQSRHGAWTEVFTAGGDIDYARPRRLAGETAFEAAPRAGTSGGEGVAPDARCRRGARAEPREDPASLRRPCLRRRPKRWGRLMQKPDRQPLWKAICRRRIMRTPDSSSMVWRPSRSRLASSAHFPFFSRPHVSLARS
jgi:hypothetical protein